MIRKMHTVTLLVVVAAGTAFTQAQSATQTTHADVQGMIRGAHTTQDYANIATYFRSRQHNFESQAQAEKVEMDRRSQITAASYQKYPRPVDSSRNRYDYFTSEAKEMNMQASHYEDLSAKP